MAKIVCGGHTGVLKVVDVAQERIVAEYGKDQQESNKCITHLQWATPSNEQEVIFARKDGTFGFIYPFKNISSASRPENEEGSEMAPIQLEPHYIVNRFESLSNDSNKNLEPGISGLFSENISDTQRNVYCCTEKGRLEIYTIEKYRKEGKCQIQSSKLLKSFSEGTHIHKMIGTKVDNNTELAYGGKDSLLKIYDVNSEKVVFRAQNDPKTDKNLQLREPVYVRDICYLNLKKNFGQIVCVATAYGQLRVYDRRTSRLPILTKKLSDNTFSCIDASPINEKEVTLGATVGGMFKCNFENATTGRKHYVFKGMNGAVTDLQYHASGEYIVSCGADRFVRLYNVKDRTMEKSFYLLQRQNCLLINSEEIALPDDDQSDSSSEKESDPDTKPGFVILGRARKKRRAEDKTWEQVDKYEKERNEKKQKKKKAKQ